MAEGERRTAAVRPAPAAAGGGAASAPAYAGGDGGLRKSLCWAYMLWALGGGLGAHHWYLQRHRQMALHMASLGGFGLAWLRDMWHLPAYVREANGDPEDCARLAARHRVHDAGPPFSVSRTLAYYVVYGIACGAVYLANPDVMAEEPAYKGLASVWLQVARVVAIPIAAQVLMVGRETIAPTRLLRRKWRLAFLLALWQWAELDGGFLVTLLPLLCRAWRPLSDRPRRKGYVSRVFVFLSAASIIYGSAGWILLFNVRIEQGDGTSFRLIDVANEVYRSPLWGQFTTAMGAIYEECTAKGWSHCKAKLVEALDVEGEQSGYAELGIPAGSEWPVVKKAYRELSRKYHPDKLDNPTEEERDRYIRINKAYETLSKLHKRRQEHNRDRM